MRRQTPDAVHQARVTCRRLRAALGTFGPLLDPAVTGPVRVELRWAARALGGARDAEVVHLRLSSLVDEPGVSVDGVPYASTQALEVLGREEYDLEVALGRGDAASHVWVSDLGHGYITINAEYHT